MIDYLTKNHTPKFLPIFISISNAHLFAVPLQTLDIQHSNLCVHIHIYVYVNLISTVT